ncbi:MAG: metal-dependent hydrolase [Patescibacteria group bacterium]|nr:metal-dependent hydrolase [Patescibacteria group bacterium]
MTGKTHQILGLSVGLTYYLVSTEPTYAPATFGAVLVFSYLAALLPDIDQPTGKLWHMLPFGHTLGKISDPFLEHRNITHSLLGVGLVGLGLHFLFKSFPPYWGIDTSVVFIASIIAYLSHLLADMFTNEGIPVFFPYHRFFGIPPKPFDGARIATGQWFENTIIFPAITILFLALILLNINLIKAILLKN